MELLRASVWSKSGFLSPVSWISLGVLSEAIEQLQNCCKRPLAVTCCQGDCKSNEVTVFSSSWVFHQLSKQSPILLNLLTTWVSLYGKKSKSRDFLQVVWKNFTDDLWYFFGMIYEQNASTSLLLRFGMLMEVYVMLKAPLWIAIFYQMNFFGRAYEYLNKYSYIKCDLNFSDETLKKGLEILVDIHRNIILLSIKLNVHFVPQLNVQI